MTWVEYFVLKIPSATEYVWALLMKVRRWSTITDGGVIMIDDALMVVWRWSTELISSAARDHQSWLTQSRWRSSITSCNKMMQILMQRVVRSVINLIEQAKGSDLSSVSQTTRFILTQPFHALRTTLSSKINETPQTTSMREHKTTGWTKYMPWHNCWSHEDTQITFLSGARHQGSWLSST